MATASNSSSVLSKLNITGFHLPVKFRLFAIIVLFALLVWRFQAFQYDRIFNNLNKPQVLYSIADSDPKASDWQKMSVQTMTDINNFLATLATGLLAGVGLLMGKVHRYSGPKHIWSGVLAAACGGASLYFGFLSHENLLTMISGQCICGPYASVHNFTTNGQFYSLLAGALFLIFFAFRDIGQENPNDVKQAKQA